MEKRRRELENAAEEIEQLFADLWQVFPFSRGIRRGYRPETDVYRTEDPPALTIVVELPGVDPNEVNELDRAASVESSWVNYLLWMLGAALAAAFAMWFFSRMRFLFGRRTANAG